MTMVTKTLMRGDVEISYTSVLLPVGKQIDMGFELVDMLAPVASIFLAGGANGAGANTEGMDEEQVTNERVKAFMEVLLRDKGSAFSRVSRSILAAGGHKYIAKLFKDCKLHRTPDGGNTVEVTTSNFDLVFSGRGGSTEVARLFGWLFEENFLDFFTDVLGSLGQ